MSDALRWLAAGNPWWHAVPPAAACSGPAATETSAPVAAGWPAGAALACLEGAGPPDILVVDGPRQTGKSHLLNALARAALADAVPGHAPAAGARPPQRLCRIALDHGPLRWQEAGALVEAWQQLAGADGPGQRLLVDDLQLWPTADQDSLAQFAVDPDRRLVVAGIALDACVARWRAAGLQVAHCRLAPRTFAARGAPAEAVPSVLPSPPRTLRELFDWPSERFAELAPAVEALQPAFLRHLRQGGFPAAAHADSPADAHKFLRETVVMRALRWDAAGLHGVRRVDQLERMLWLAAECSGGLLDVPALCRQVDVERPTVRHFLDLLEQAGLLQRVPPLGYGDQVQRARPLLSLGDPGLLAALRGSADQVPDTAQAQCALLVHLQAAYGGRGGRLRAVTAGRQPPALLVVAGDSVLPFGLHWQASPATARSVSTLTSFCIRARIPRLYLATRDAADFGPLALARAGAPAIMQVPAALLCHWLAAAAVTSIDRGGPS